MREAMRPLVMRGAVCPARTVALVEAVARSCTLERSRIDVASLRFGVGVRVDACAPRLCVCLKSGQRSSLSGQCDCAGVLVMEHRCAAAGNAAKGMPHAYLYHAMRRVVEQCGTWSNERRDGVGEKPSQYAAEQREQCAEGGGTGAPTSEVRSGQHSESVVHVTRKLSSLVCAVLLSRFSLRL